MTTSTALLGRTPGSSKTLTLKDVPTPEAGPGQMRVQVRARDVDFSDMLIIEDRYQMHPPHPSSPRAEIVGNRAFVAREPARSLTSIADLLRLYAEGKLSLKVSETLPLARVGNAIMAWLQGTAIGKRVIAIA